MVQKDNAKNSVTQQKNGETLHLLKSNKNLRKLAGNLFPMQYQWKQRNSTAHKPKHAFPAIQLKVAYFKHIRKKTLFLCDTKLKPAPSRCQHTKTCFRQVRASKTYFMQENVLKVVLRKIMLKTVSLSQKQAKTLF